MAHFSGTPGTPDDVNGKISAAEDDQIKGLTTAEAVDAIARYGLNELPPPRDPIVSKLFARLMPKDVVKESRKEANDIMRDTKIIVKRNGKFETMQSRDIVPGDLIIASAGLVLPADVRWVSGGPLQVDTSPMTGIGDPREYSAATEKGELILCTMKVLKVAKLIAL